MLCIDQLKYDYYNEVANYIASLCDGFSISIYNKSFCEYNKENEGSCFYRYLFTLKKFSFCVTIDELICQKFNFKYHKDAELLYQKSQVHDILLTLLPH